VDLVTWNDFNESTYFAPVSDPGQYQADLQIPVRNPHRGYLELSKHYIGWFKSGQKPAIGTDALFYFYRTHPRNAIAANTNDTPITTLLGDVADVLYTTTLLTAPAQLEITSGTTLVTNLMPAGVSHWRTPFTPGSQSFTLRRNGQQLLSLHGADISNQIQNYDFFPASGYAYAKPAPPSDVRVTAP
jgi:hypothetical protein